MNRVTLLATVGALAMLVALANAFVSGDGTAELSAVLALPWGITSLVDLYVGFTLFSGWIVFREKSRWKALIWVIGMMVFGFLTGAIYVLLAARSSRGSWDDFWMGSRQ